VQGAQLSDGAINTNVADAQEAGFAKSLINYLLNSQAAPSRPFVFERKFYQGTLQSCRSGLNF